MDAVELTAELVRAESTNPGTFEGRIGKYICGYLENAGIKAETSEIEKGRELVRAVLPGQKDYPSLIFVCHMDTVVAGSGWTGNPFSGEISDGKVWGRGSCDMKSGLACALTAFAGAAEEIREGKLKLKHSLVFIGTVDEEGDMKGIEKAVSRGWIQKNDFVLDMEPTSGTVQMAHKGRAWFVLEAKGVTAHASMPEKGADAIAGMAYAAAGIREKTKCLPVHKELGKTTVTFGQISGGYSPYVVPDSCSVTIDMRLVPPADIKRAETIIKEAAAAAEKEVPGVVFSYHITGDRPAVETNPDSILLHALLASDEKITGKRTEVRPFPGYTDTAVAAVLTGNKNCMSYGPGDLAMAHKPDEFVEISDINRCVRVYSELIRKMNAE